MVRWYGLLKQVADKKGMLLTLKLTKIMLHFLWLKVEEFYERDTIQFWCKCACFQSDQLCTPPRRAHCVVKVPNK